MGHAKQLALFSSGTGTPALENGGHPVVLVLHVLFVRGGPILFCVQGGVMIVLLAAWANPVIQQV